MVPLDTTLIAIHKADISYVSSQYYTICDDMLTLGVLTFDYIHTVWKICTKFCMWSFTWPGKAHKLFFSQHLHWLAKLLAITTKYLMNPQVHPVKSICTKFCVDASLNNRNIVDYDHHTVEIFCSKLSKTQQTFQDSIILRNISIIYYVCTTSPHKIMHVIYFRLWFKLEKN